MQPPLEGLRSVRGQDDAVALLLRAVRSDRVASAYLFEGASGVGKERAARALAQATVCESRQADGDACGKCVQCRHVDANSHVDVLTLAREIDVLSQQEHRPSDVKSEIVVDKVRLLQTERLQYLSHQGHRWVIVRNAHEMNASASNALLKTLEEPPPQTHFVLVTAEPALLLGTIRSRCQRVRFAPLETSIVRDLLVARGTEPKLAEDAAKLSDGSMTRGAEFADAELLSARRRWVERIVAALQSGRPGGFVEISEELKALAKETKGSTPGKGPAEVDAVLTLLLRHFRDEAVTHAADARRASVCAARAELVHGTIDALDRGNNLNAQMVIESMLVRLREVRG